MGWIHKGLMALGAITLGAMAAAQDPGPAVPSQGQLLYETHCISCHTTQVHWRARRVATDWSSLQAQVLRWQAHSGLAWREAEVLEVTRYLNDSIYRFSPMSTPLSVRQDQAPRP